MKNHTVTNKLVVLDPKTKAPLHVHFGKIIEGVKNVSRTNEPEGFYGEQYGVEWDEKNMSELSIFLYYSKNNYLFEIQPDFNFEVILDKIDKLFD